MKKIFFSTLLLLASFSAWGQEDSIDPNEPAKTSLLIPSPVEMILRGKSLEVVADISVGIEDIQQRFEQERRQNSTVEREAAHIMVDADNELADENLVVLQETREFRLNYPDSKTQ